MVAVCEKGLSPGYREVVQPLALGLRKPDGGHLSELAVCRRLARVSPTRFCLTSICRRGNSVEDRLAHSRHGQEM